MEDPLIDWEQLDMIADGYTPDFMQIYDEFLSLVPELFQELETACQAGDAARVARASHQIKGTAANFGFIGVSSPADRIEQNARAGALEGAPAEIALARKNLELCISEVTAARNK